MTGVQTCALPISTEYVYCVGRQNPLAQRSSIAFEELREEQLILFGPGSTQNRDVRRRFAECGGTPEVLLCSSNQTTISGYLRSYPAGAFLFQENVALDAALVGIPLNSPWPFTFGLIWKRGRAIYSYTAKFISFAKAYAKQ